MGRVSLRLRASMLALASLLAGATPATAQNAQVQRGPVPDWVTPSKLLPVPDDVAGPVFMRRQDVLVHLTRDGEAQHLGYRIKILHSSALQLGNFSVAWNPAAGSATVHAITVHRDGAAIDVLDTATFEVLRREEQLEQAQLDGRLTAVLRIPDLRVGDELEVAFTTVNNDPTLRGEMAGLLVLAPTPPPGRYRTGLSWQKGAKPAIRMTPDMAAAAQEGEGALDVRFDNPPTLSPPKDAPPRYQWQRLIEYSDYADWAQVSRHFAPLYAHAATVPADSPVRREAARIAAAHATPMARAAAALKLVQQDVRYIYVGLDGGNLTPASAEETWQRRWGDCKGKTALLLALLAAMDIDAQAVLVNAGGFDDGLDQRLPSPQPFDHVLVRATIDGVPYWLDGTLPPVVPPGTRPMQAFRWALPLSKRGATIEQQAWAPQVAPDTLYLYEIDARAGFDTPARITSTTISRGLKGLGEQIQFSALAPAQMLSAFRQELTGDTWQSIEDVRWRYDQKAAASILTITGTGAVDWDEGSGGSRSFALPGGGFSPPEKRIRGADQPQDVPFYAAPEYDCRVTTVRLPESTKPAQWSSTKSYVTRLFGRTYYRGFEQRDGAIRMVRGTRVEQPEIDAATALADNARIARFDNSMAWITFDPEAHAATVGDGERVPATYDIDWTAEDVPCGVGAAAKR